MKILVNVFNSQLEDEYRFNNRGIQELKIYEELTANAQYANYPDWKIDIEKEQ